jgi:hypothetical protein
MSFQRRQLLLGEVTVRSLESVGTWHSDIDMGVVRVAGALLAPSGGRNSLVRISMLDEDNSPGPSIVGIVRAATGAGGKRAALTNDQIALQYDDRVKLGIKKVGTKHKMRIEAVNRWRGIPHFLLGHSSPLVRIQSLFAIALMILGAIVGFLAGLAI